MSDLVINKLPGRTFEWLGVNETVLADFGNMEAVQYKIEAPATVAYKKEAQADIYEIPGDFKAEPPVYLQFAYGAFSKNEIEIHVHAGSEVTFVLDHTSVSGEKISAMLSAKVKVHRYAKVKWIQIDRLTENVNFVNEISADCEDGAQFSVTQLFLGGGSFYQDLHCDLNGYQSEFTADAAYMIEKNGILDMNYVVDHYGKKTVSNINLSGVLRDRAAKIFRGTIDFKNGASGSEGAEKEDVLLMDPTVDNKTIPLILCDEENVSGTHGATIGRLGDSLLFYLESRGMTRKAIYEMMARARLDALVNKIEDERTREVIWEHLGHDTLEQ